MRRQALAVAFCAQAEKQVPTVGDRVYVGACGSEGTIVGVGDDGQCSIKFGSGDISEVHDYKTMGLTKETRKVPGSARLRLLLPPLSPPEQLTARTSGALNGLAQRVEEHARSRCSESPHTRDSMSRRVDVFLHERKQALIKTEPVEEMYADFEKQHSGEGPRCKLSTYKNYLPWNMKDAYRETCLCAHCESQRLHMEGLRVAAKLLQPVVDTAVQEREAAEEEAAMRRQRRRAAEQADRAAAEAARACLSSMPAEPGCGSGAAADVTRQSSSLRTWASLWPRRRRWRGARRSTPMPTQATAPMMTQMMTNLMTTMHLLRVTRRTWSTRRRSSQRCQS